ncbi:hypothetical protein FRC06_010162, partial [Ceratobasidium sp. 370]
GTCSYLMKAKRSSPTLVVSPWAGTCRIRQTPNFPYAGRLQSYWKGLKSKPRRQMYMPSEGQY